MLGFIYVSLFEFLLEIKYTEPHTNSNIWIIVGANLMPPILWNIQHITFAKRKKLVDGIAYDLKIAFHRDGRFTGIVMK